MARKSNGTCRVAGCTHPVKHKAARMCNACYSFANYWKNKTVTQRMKRADKLHFWARRSEELLEDRKVVPIRKAHKKHLRTAGSLRA